MKIKVRYLTIRPGAAGQPPRYFWQPSQELRALGWRNRRLTHADGRPVTTLEEAVDMAQVLNAELDAWRKGGASKAAPPPPPKQVESETVAHMIRLYKEHRRFLAKAEKTRQDYLHHLKMIEQWAGDVPVKKITRPIVQDYYEVLLETGKHAAANARLRVLRILLQLAVDLGFATDNAASQPGLVGVAPRVRVWTPAEEAAFIAAADAAGWASVGDAVALALATGQRQGDLLALPALALAADGAGGYRLHLKQSKRGARIAIPIPADSSAAVRLAAADQRRAALNADRAGRRLPPVTTALWHEKTAKRWEPFTFRHVFAAVRLAAAATCPGLADLTFQDLRDTTITRLAEAGCTIPEICAVSGHSEAGAVQVLKHYLALNSEMAESAIAKLLARQAAKKAKEG